MIRDTLCLLWTLLVLVVLEVHVVRVDHEIRDTLCLLCTLSVLVVQDILVILAVPCGVLINETHQITDLKTRSE
jgi:hypothetical protein